MTNNNVINSVFSKMQSHVSEELLDLLVKDEPTSFEEMARLQRQTEHRMNPHKSGNAANAWAYHDSTPGNMKVTYGNNVVVVLPPSAVTKKGTIKKGVAKLINNGNMTVADAEKLYNKYGVEVSMAA